MSGALISRVWGLGLLGSHLNVFLALTHEADDESLRSHPSVRLLMWKTDYSQRQVQRALSKLRSLGLICVIGQDKETGANEYEIDFEKGTKREIPTYTKDKVSYALREKTIRQFNYVCHYCSKPGNVENGPDDRRWHIDRVIPGKHGGLYTEDNVVLSCGTCNRIKGSKLAGKI